ncbi:hypothetical protein [Burkholderia ubonensis]|uniref:hypothetical protein n=1 Tax=Burkholderia ubonensis TaxID=101571 RepID=UPI0012FAA751|nr:hypothetical protein [Burkholderia ubonensis]
MSTKEIKNVVSASVRVVDVASLRNGSAHREAQVRLLSLLLSVNVVGRTISVTGMASRFVKKIKNKFRGAIGLSVPAAILLSACAPLTVDQMPAREQRDFLRDIKKNCRR